MGIAHNWRNIYVEMFAFLENIDLTHSAKK